MEDPKENQPNVMALAKQGEPKAIAFLFNRKLNGSSGFRVINPANT
jgi:hypothetical protein